MLSFWEVKIQHHVTSSRALVSSPVTFRGWEGYGSLLPPWSLCGSLHPGTWKTSGKGDSRQWGQPHDSHPHRPHIGAPGEPLVASSGRGCAERRGATQEAADLSGSFFTTLSQLSRLKQLQMNHHKAIMLVSPPFLLCRSAWRARGPRRTAWATFCRHLLCPWASPGWWAWRQHHTLGCRHCDGNRRELRMQPQMLVQGLCIRGAAIHPRILILNKMEFNSKGCRRSLPLEFHLMHIY